MLLSVVVIAYIIKEKGDLEGEFKKYLHLESKQNGARVDTRAPFWGGFLLLAVKDTDQCQHTVHNQDDTGNEDRNADGIVHNQHQSTHDANRRLNEAEDDAPQLSALLLGSDALDQQENTVDEQQDANDGQCICFQKSPNQAAEYQYDGTEDGVDQTGDDTDSNEVKDGKNQKEDTEYRQCQRDDALTLDDKKDTQYQR